MEIGFLNFLTLVSSLYFEKEILTFNVNYESPNALLDQLRNSPESWNVELNTIDIYTCKLSKKDVQFTVRVKNDSSLNISIYLPDIKSLCFKSIVFYITAFPLNCTSAICKTEIYQVEALADNAIIFHEINPRLVRFILTMAYLYQGIIKIDDDNFINSNYQDIIKGFIREGRSLFDTFNFDYPILNRRLRKGLVDYIRTFIWYYVDVEFLWAKETEFKVFVEDLIYEDELIIRNFPYDQFKLHLKGILEYLEEEIEYIYPFLSRFPDIYSMDKSDLENPLISCCLLQ